MIVGKRSVALAWDGCCVVFSERIVVCHLDEDGKSVETCGHLLWIDVVIESILRLVGGSE